MVAMAYSHGPKWAKLRMEGNKKAALAEAAKAKGAKVDKAARPSVEENSAGKDDVNVEHTSEADTDAEDGAGDGDVRWASEPIPALLMRALAIRRAKQPNEGLQLGYSLVRLAEWFWCTADYERVG